MSGMLKNVKRVVMNARNVLSIPTVDRYRTVSAEFAFVRTAINR